MSQPVGCVEPLAISTTAQAGTQLRFLPGVGLDADDDAILDVRPKDTTSAAIVAAAGRHNPYATR